MSNGLLVYSGIKVCWWVGLQRSMGATLDTSLSVSVIRRMVNEFKEKLPPFLRENNFHLSSDVMLIIADLQ